MNARKALEYLRTIFTVKRNFARQANANDHADIYDDVLREVERADSVVVEADANTKAPEGPAVIQFENKIEDFVEKELH